MSKQKKGIILNNGLIADKTYKMSISSDVENIHSGQFISILCQNKTLRRPFSVSYFMDGEITIMYKLKGEGTDYLSHLKIGDSIDFLAPLGNTFNFEGIKNPLLVGAGIGIAPMLFLKDELNKAKIKSFLISGFKTENEAIEGSDKTVIGGSVLDNMEDLIKEIKPDIIYSCGPRIVLEFLSKMAQENNIKIQIAMEKIMACGIGVCRGCVIDLKSGKKASVCKDGPVFDGGIIKW